MRWKWKSIRRASAMGCASKRVTESFAYREPEHALGVAMADLLLVGVRQIERVDDLDGGADITRPLLLVEGTIGREQHVVGAEEVDAANGCGAGALDRGIAVETLEIVVGALLEPLEQRRLVLVRGARAQLVPAMPDTSLEIGNDSAEVMRDDLEVRIAVHDSGKDQPRKRRPSLEWPAEHAADFIFRVLLGGEVRHFAGARGMQEYRLAGSRDDLENRPELLLVERRAVHIGPDLDCIGAVFEHALGFRDGLFRHVHRQHGGIADECLG